MLWGSFSLSAISSSLGLPSCPTVPLVFKSTPSISTSLHISEWLSYIDPLSTSIFDLETWLTFCLSDNTPASLLGSFSIHVDNPADSATSKLLFLTASVDLLLETNPLAHCHGHSLNLVFTKNYIIANLSPYLLQYLPQAFPFPFPVSYGFCDPQSNILCGLF